MKKLIEKLQEQIDSIDMCHEISAEFTPAASYEILLDIIVDSEFTFEEVSKYLKAESKKEFEENKLEGTTTGVKIKDLDHSYTQAGQLYMELQMIDNIKW